MRKQIFAPNGDSRSDDARQDERVDETPLRRPRPRRRKTRENQQRSLLADRCRRSDQWSPIFASSLISVWPHYSARRTPPYYNAPHGDRQPQTGSTAADVGDDDGFAHGR